jgi:hypothetical protein
MNSRLFVTAADHDGFNEYEIRKADKDRLPFNLQEFGLDETWFRRFIQRHTAKPCLAALWKIKFETCK